jgi:hypothetical protein
MNICRHCRASSSGIQGGWLPGAGWLAGDWRKIYLVSISLPLLVMRKRYSSSLWTITISFRVPNNTLLLSLRLSLSVSSGGIVSPFRESLTFFIGFDQ